MTWAFEFCGSSPTRLEAAVTTRDSALLAYVNGCAEQHELFPSNTAVGRARWPATATKEPAGSAAKKGWGQRRTGRTHVPVATKSDAASTPPLAASAAGTITRHRRVKVAAGSAAKGAPPRPQGVGDVAKGSVTMAPSIASNTSGPASAGNSLAVTCTAWCSQTALFAVALALMAAVELYLRVQH